MTCERWFIIDAAAGRSMIGRMIGGSATGIPPSVMEAGEDDVILCPHCQGRLCLTQETRHLLLAELRSWDRRFDGPESVLDNLLSLLPEGVEVCP